MRIFGRHRRVALALLIGACPTATFAQESIVTAQKPTNAAPARPGDIAIREEFDAARSAGTIAAYDLFIARHPDHALAEEARRERARLAREGRDRSRSKP